MTWHAQRFIQSDSKKECECVVCGKKYWLPPSKSNKYLTCGGECASERNKRTKESRKRRCVTCGTEFIPRKIQIDNGIGIYCSPKCNTKAHIAMNTKDAHVKAGIGFKKAIQDGRYVPPAGNRHYGWKGGYEVSFQRRKEEGRLSVYLKRYRAKNPHKVREWSRRRSAGKTGRLPKGTVSWLFALQRSKCAICKNSLRSGYHVDHIYPIARGGKHEKSNVQLLCPSCNVRKSAKDPIQYMQSRGFLL